LEKLPVEIRDGTVDVAEVMGRIRERIRGRRDQGLYSDDEVDELYALKVQALARLMAPNHNWNISPDYRIETHREGFSARWVLGLKKLVRPWVRLYTDQIIGRQAQLNLYMVHLCHNAVRELVRLQLEHTALRNRCERLEAEVKALRGGGGAPGA
jgi:hypothetical protein